jgi:putative MATE family efflux protein
MTDDRKAVQTSSRPVHPALHGILAGPVLPMMLRLALPTTIVLVVQTGVGVLETYFLGLLGTDTLAGVTLVFPVLMLMQMMANGGVGGGVASAVARALGAERHADADALVWHAVVLAAAFGAAFTALALFLGPGLYVLMGATETSLAAAVTYSGLVFGAAIPIWITALLSSALRGAGNVVVPALVILLGAVILVPLSPALIFGWGPFPRLGVGGGGAAVVIYYVLAASVLASYLRSPHGKLRLRIAVLEWRLFKDIMGVGLFAAIGTAQVNLTVTLVTAAVGHFGIAAIAGYGIASRLDYILIPLIFGLGTAMVTMVGVNIGAGQAKRARRIAWIGAAAAFMVTEAVGLAAALLPRAWIGLFSDDHQVLRVGAEYLRTAAPFYGAVGLGLALYFASQGASRVILPVLAGTARMVIAAFVGWSAVRWFGADAATLFRIVAISSVAYGVLTVAAIRSSAWGRSG